MRGRAVARIVRNNSFPTCRGSKYVGNLPKRIANDKECDICFVCACEDLIATAFN